MHGVPEQPSPQTRTAVTTRIKAHVQRGWPHLGEPDVTHRLDSSATSRPAYPATGNPSRSATGATRINRPLDHRDLPRDSDQRHTDRRTAHVLCPKTGTPEQGIDHTFISMPAPAASP